MIALTRNERRALLLLGSLLLIGGLVRGLRPPPTLSWDEAPGELTGEDGGDSTGFLAVDPNTASSQELQTLPGIGPVLGEAIIRFRERRGPFPDREALLQVPGIGPKRLEQLQPYLRLPGEPSARRVRGGRGRSGRDLLDLNRVGMSQLLRLPGIGSTLARRILAFRESRGGFRSVEDLEVIGGLSGERLERLRPLVWVDFDTATGG